MDKQDERKRKEKEEMFGLEKHVCVKKSVFFKDFQIRLVLSFVGHECARVRACVRAREVIKKA